MIYDDYINYCKVYTNKYGDKTVVFMQVGDFFELYAVINGTEKLGADIYTVCDICNIQVSRKNKTVIENSRSNPLMAGFPIGTISKFIQIMVNNNYTCVLIRQVTPPPNPKREVTEIISPSTTMTIVNKEGIFLMVTYWESYRNIMNVGIALVDLTTGKSCIYEACGSMQDPEFAKDEFVRYTNLYQPKEIVYIGNLNEVQIADINAITPHTIIHSRWNMEDVKHFTKPVYQNLILEKVFGKTGVITPIESLDFEKYTIACIAYSYMIQFAYEHNENIILDMSAPIHLKDTHHLSLEANCIYQLNIDSANQNETPLIRILNRTSTAFGCRMFREYILNPIIDKTQLEYRYDKIEVFQANDLYKDVIRLLQSIVDLERIIRKIGMGKLHPCEWLTLASSLELSKDIFKMVENTFSNGKELYKYVLDIIHDYSETLDIEECSKYNMTDIYTSLFKESIYSDIDAITKSLKNNFSYLENVRIKISDIGSGDTTLCRLDCNEREGYHLTITKKRWEHVQHICPENVVVDGEKICWKECKVKPISTSSSILRLSHPKIDAISDLILLNQKRISQLNSEYYAIYQRTFYEKYSSNFANIVKVLGEIDIFCTNAKNAKDFKYVRPIIIDGQNTSSVEINELRHPIIERFNNSTEYVSNDISIGIDKKGLLLYGINASGKSSLMKSIGLSVIMAQAGMFVSASKYVLSPYHHIFTRISGADNIYRGLSTFTIEMLELKNILNRCDQHSLILGDELCAGTECVSAVAIVASGIEYLLNRNSCFVFATHLHELLDIDFIKEHEALNISHLHIEMDNDTGKIVYDRKLKNGNGNKIYGLEVCRFLKMSDRFLDRANIIRKKMQHIPEKLVEPKISKYNSSIYVDSCSLCGNPATETHHIKQQKDADNEGYIGNMHKDSCANLIALCNTCHLKQHNGEMKVEKLVMTSIGTEPVFEETHVIDDNDNDQQNIEVIKDYLHYSIQGWKYRLKETDIWKKLLPTHYEKVFSKLKKVCDVLPRKKEEIDVFLRENQSSLLVFVK